MSLTEQTPIATATLVTATDAIPFPYRFEADSELHVVSDQRGTLTLTTHYTVTGEGTDTSGEVTMVGGTVGERIYVRRKTPISQALVLRTFGAYFVEDVATALDKLTKISQEQGNYPNKPFAFGVHTWAGGSATTDSISVAGLFATDVVVCTLVARSGSEQLVLAEVDADNAQIDLTLSANGTDGTTKVSYLVLRA